MFLQYQGLVLLLVFITSCLGSPLDRSQTNVTPLASCAPAALIIDQFGTFTGNAGQQPDVTFYVTNPNPGAPGKMLCTATLGASKGSFNDSGFYSCEVHLVLRDKHKAHADLQHSTQAPASIGSQDNLEFFNTKSARTVSSSKFSLSPFLQTPLITSPSTSSRQVAVLAQGEIPTTSYPGELGGEYSESVTGSNSIPVVNVQDVQSINGGTGRPLDEQNVTCGFLGPSDIVYTLGSCNLSDVGQPVRS